jgi:aldehyde dehydrogenase (NAD+)
MNKNPYQNLFDDQINRFMEVGRTTYKQRLKKLQDLKRALEVDYKQPLREALFADFGKPFLETDLTEIYPILAEIKHIERNLRDWMRPKKVGNPLTMVGSRSYIEYESKGVCLIMSPWNFPVILTFDPLVSAIAAGNCCIVKPSESTPATSQVMSEIVSALFDPAEVVVVQGEVDTAKALLELPFHHIFFTGSPAVGKHIMQAASRHLTSVTLELGGKSPAFVDETASLVTTAKRLAWGKCLNAGQICVAPDYVLVTEKAKDALVGALKTQLQSFFPKGASDSSSYARIINSGHHRRLQDALNTAVSDGAEVYYGGGYSEEDHFFEPTLIGSVPEDATLLQEEIFGPVLPIVTVRNVDEAVNFINRKPRPLALYTFSKSKTAIQKLSENTRAGGACINHNVVHLSNNHLPFGGVNNSGIGKAHGYHGFLAFSNERGTVRQYTPSSIDLLMPPYSDFKQRMVDVTLRWFK